MEELIINQNNMTKEIKAPKTAKEMFEELGYEHGLIDEESFIYTKDYSIFDLCVAFDKAYKCYSLYKMSGGFPAFSCEPFGFVDMEVNKAINKQVEELGWNN